MPAIRFIALMPTRGSVAGETVGALVRNAEQHDLVLRMAHRQPVDVARNRLAQEALRAADDRALFAPDVDPFVFWIDSDAFFLKGTFSLMMRELEAHPELDVLAAYFGPRAPFAGSTAFVKANDMASSVVAGTTCEPGAVVRVETVGLHFVVHRVSLLRRLGPQPFGSPLEAAADDSRFCASVRAVGGTIAVATGIPVFHVDERNGTAFFPGARALIVDGDRVNTELSVTALPFEQRSFGTRVDSAKRTIVLTPAGGAESLAGPANPPKPTLP